MATEKEKADRIKKKVAGWSDERIQESAKAIADAKLKGDYDPSPIKTFGAGLTTKELAILDAAGFLESEQDSKIRGAGRILNEERKRVTKDIVGKEAYEAGSKVGKEIERGVQTISEEGVRITDDTLDVVSGGLVDIYGAGVSRPKGPPVDLPEPEPIADPLADSNIGEALKLARQRRSQMSGRQSTIRTTPLGLTNRQAPEEKVLLGT